MTQTTEVFNKRLNIIEQEFDIKLSGKNVAQRFKTLHKLTQKDSMLSEKVKSYGKFVKSNAMNESNENITLESDLKPAVIDTLFYALVQGMAHIYGEATPQVHHWLPVTYMKMFGINAPKSSRTRAIVRGIAFAGSSPLDIEVKDETFAHTKDEGYDLPIEAFFSYIETIYTHARDQEIRGFSYVSMAAFFIAQSVRNPHPASGFIAKDMESIINAMIENIESMDSLLGVFADSETRMPISPYIPTRVLKLADGSRVFVFPISSKQSFILSDKRITNSESANLLQRYREGVIKKAHQDNGVIFGISSGEAMQVL